ncbi:hypothetical protein ACTQ54_03165 [Fundicoccus sp. Sow4_H7]|uniref:hypothetical protein n=1 Tax=Fundicoccus sp. Sow4_H7 TaxID=3438784 RepID=UPI003F9182B3
MEKKYGWQTNHILRKLPIYLNGGAEQDWGQRNYEQILKVLEKLNDDELRFVKAKYIDLVSIDEKTKEIRLPTIKAIRKHLEIPAKELADLIDVTNKKVVTIHRKLINEEEQRTSERRSI